MLRITHASVSASDCANEQRNAMRIINEMIRDDLATMELVMVVLLVMLVLMRGGGRHQQEALILSRSEYSRSR